jgi:2-dehydrotetronate isomerase
MIPARCFSAHLSMLFTEAPFVDRFALAAQAGFSAVECWFPYALAAPICKARLTDSGLRMVAINTSPGDEARGQFGLAILPDQRPAFRQSVLQALDYAATIGCANIHVLAGNRPIDANDDIGDARCRAVYLENLAWAVAQAAQAGVTVLIEPLNPIDRPRYFLSQSHSAYGIVDSLNTDHCKVIFDTYHLQMTQGRLLTTFVDHWPAIGHVQIADVPGRHEPGTGEIRFPALFAAIADSGYLAAGGMIGCEFRPSGAGDIWAWRRQATFTV